jgi:hypothetical protein
MTAVTVSGMSMAQGDARYRAARSIQSVSPTAGLTVQMQDDAADGSLNLSPAGLLLTLTVTLPSEANSRIGQVRRLSTTQAVTTLTVNGAASILNNVTTLALGGTVAFEKIAANTWVRI